MKTKTKVIINKNKSLIDRFLDIDITELLYPNKTDIWQLEKGIKFQIESIRGTKLIKTEKTYYLFDDITGFREAKKVCFNWLIRYFTYFLEGYDADFLTEGDIEELNKDRKEWEKQVEQATHILTNRT